MRNLDVLGYLEREGGGESGVLPGKIPGSGGGLGCPVWYHALPGGLLDIIVMFQPGFSVASNAAV